MVLTLWLWGLLAMLWQVLPKARLDTTVPDVQTVL